MLETGIGTLCMTSGHSMNYGISPAPRFAIVDLHISVRCGTQMALLEWSDTRTIGLKKGIADQLEYSLRTFHVPENNSTVSTVNFQHCFSRSLAQILLLMLLCIIKWGGRKDNKGIKDARQSSQGDKVAIWAGVLTLGHNKMDTVQELFWSYKQPNLWSVWCSFEQRKNPWVLPCPPGQMLMSWTTQETQEEERV